MNTADGAHALTSWVGVAIEVGVDARLRAADLWPRPRVDSFLWQVMTPRHIMIMRRRIGAPYISDHVPPRQSWDLHSDDGFLSGCVNNSAPSADCVGGLGDADDMSVPMRSGRSEASGAARSFRYVSVVPWCARTCDKNARFGACRRDSTAQPPPPPPQVPPRAHAPWGGP